MSHRVLSLVFCGLALALPAAGQVERTLEKTFAATATPTLRMEAFHGDIAISTHDQAEIKVLVRQAINVKTEAEADKRLADVDFIFEQKGDEVVLRALYKRAVRWVWEDWPPVKLSFKVLVPRVCNLDVLARDGGITVGNLHGDVKLKAFSGAVFTGEIEGSLAITNVRGDISVTACTEKLTLEAKAGNVSVGRTGAIAIIKGAGGDVEIQSVRGRLDVEANGSDLKVGFAHPISGTAKLYSAGGDIAASLDPRSACTVSARASTFGEVKLRELSLGITSGQAGGARVEGTLNGGGPAIDIRASGGNIRLNGVPTEP